jgi:hypothetical protein
VVNNQVKVTGTMTHPGYDGYYRYFIGLNSAVSDTTYFSTGTFTVAGTALNTGINTDVYPAASAIYVIIYGMTNGDGGYVDVTNGNIYYPSLSKTPSSVATITVP